MTMQADLNVPRVWAEVSGWPPAQRLALATRLLQSLERDTAAVTVPPGRSEALTALIGLWKTEHALTDEAVRRIVEEERDRKYG